jgi:outer membrane lipoprotein-sorting protein
VNQALAAAGGVDVIRAIKDYTATGTMTTGTAGQTSANPISLTIMGQGPSQFRMDSNASEGVTSWAMYHGKVSTLATDGHVIPSTTISPLSPSTLIFPHLLLASALNTPMLSLTYKGVVQINGNSAHDIQVLLATPQGVDPKLWRGSLSAVDVLVDTSTFQVLATRDMIRTIRNNQYGYSHEIQYSDYTTTNGVSMPYSISESMNGQQPRALRLSSISFNSGLTDSQFQLQQAAQ